MVSVYCQRELVRTKSFLPELLSLCERRRKLAVPGDEAREVAHHGLEDGPVAVGLVDALADVGERLRVVDGQTALFDRIDEGRVERRLAQRVEGVDPVVAGRRGADLLRVVELAQLALCRARGGRGSPS